ncbi:MAG TPA: TylF/MycF/NovP-related O-methyltransferase [Gammaproteobacteria bacterium]|nr:TylF/MycF/NovP-related O-methyltransferase [Gammaproteobacteria bacterium]
MVADAGTEAGSFEETPASSSGAAQAPSAASTGQRTYSLYLELLKHCLIDSLYLDDPLSDYMLYREKPHTAYWKRIGVRLIQRILQPYGVKLVERHWVPWMEEYAKMDPAEKRDRRERGFGWPLRAHTFLSLPRLDNIQYCVETALREGVPGDLIETGVWRGGACILMRALLEANGDATRSVWLADSFAGLPAPDTEQYPADKKGKHHLWTEFVATRAEVEGNFRRYGLLDDRVRFLEGWFKNTLPAAPIERLAVLRLDGDMYESTLQALESLYDRLSPGGFVIIDDYWLAPCAQAVNDFRAARGIADEIADIDGRGVFWRRSV